MTTKPARTRKPYVHARAAEPSTWAGLTGILAAMLPALPPQYQAVASAVAAVAGAVAVFKADPPKE
jgi:hypothetical protein